MQSFSYLKMLLVLASVAGVIVQAPEKRNGKGESYMHVQGELGKGRGCVTCPIPCLSLPLFSALHKGYVNPTPPLI